jgi:PAS domain S-box-containing protein
MNFGVTAVLFAPPIVAISYVIALALRRQSAPGGRYLVYLTASNLLWLCGYAVQLNVGTTQWNVLVAQVEFVGVATSPVFFLLFAVRYTHGYSLSRLQEWGLFVVPAITLVLVWTNPLHGLLWTDYQLQGWYGLWLVERQFGPWFFIHGLYSYLTFLAGVMLFVNLLLDRNFLFRRQALAVLVGTVVPVMLTIPYLLGLSPIDGLDLTPFAFAVGGVTFGYAFVDTEFYDVIPAIKTIGWEHVANEIDTGLLVTDIRTKVVEANQTICDMFDVDRTEIIGQPLTVLFEESDAFVRVSNGYEIAREDDSTVEIQANSVRDGRGNRIGFTFTVVDVTERKSREQQLQVLNRVLRHNLRNKAMVITGNAERIEGLTEGADDERLAEIGDLAASITTASDRISEMGDTARQIDGVMQESSIETQDLAAVLGRSTAEIERRDEDRGVRTDVETGVAVRASRTLERAITHLLENAFRHNPPGTNVTVRATAVDDRVELVVDDDGNGIPEHELRPLENGVETALDHGSGLGLWLVRWTVEASNGTVDIETDERHGTTITLGLPRGDPEDVTALP